MLCLLVYRGGFGLWLDADLYRGSSFSCPTFSSPSLSTHKDFFVQDVEVWTVRSWWRTNGNPQRENLRNLQTVKRTCSLDTAEQNLTRWQLLPVHRAQVGPHTARAWFQLLMDWPLCLCRISQHLKWLDEAFQGPAALKYCVSVTLRRTKLGAEILSFKPLMADLGCGARYHTTFTVTLLNGMFACTFNISGNC